MDYKMLSNIEKTLKSIECKSYTLEIQYDDNNKIYIEKKAVEEERKIGFSAK